MKNVGVAAGSGGRVVIKICAPPEKTFSLVPSLVTRSHFKMRTHELVSVSVVYLSVLLAG